MTWIVSCTRTINVAVRYLAILNVARNAELEQNKANGVLEKGEVSNVELSSRAVLLNAGDICPPPSPLSEKLRRQTQSLAPDVVTTLKFG